ncbi:MFS transporter [Tardiphaga sp.]|uniref:MFS transporter n=1 Tax=Tardiphaga sp. TaxID=1926292 RepID=UPI00262AEF58|nr:MFS transporter [Tardiphaga sp.]MDB5617516.1 sugar phosphate permease [Tardiphaga sp.]
MNSAIEPLPAPTETTAPRVGVALMAAMVVLTCGHVLSNLLRTTPAVAIDVMAVDLHSTAQKLAALTAAYHFSFAMCQIPIGVALDRYSIRNVSLVLFAGTLVGACMAALSQGSASFLLAQIIMGMATSGMLLCPMALAAKRLTPAQFGLWSGLILSLGNGGLLLSSAPLAFVVEHWGWRSGFWLSGVAACAVALLVLLIVPNDKPPASTRRALLTEMTTVLRLGVSPALRGIVILAFVSLAVQIVLRGLWAGPWLMNLKALSRIEAGNVLLLFTIALVLAPTLSGVVDRRLGHRRLLLLGSQLLAAALFVAMALGGPGQPLSVLFGVAIMPVPFDIGVLVLIGFLICVQPLIYAMTRQVVPAEHVGKALSAVNLSFFLGTAVMQSATSPIAAAFGLPAVLIAMAAMLATGAVAFYILTSPAKSRVSA